MRDQSLQVSSLTDFIRCRQAELDQLYRGAQSSPIPHGISDGAAMFFPNSRTNLPVAHFARIFWQGKIFNAQTRMLINRVMGFRAVKARLYEGESWFDGKPSVIIDYSGTSWIFGFVRDEIREITPGFWLGRAYAKTPFGNFNVVNFALRIKSH